MSSGEAASAPGQMLEERTPETLTARPAAGAGPTWHTRAALACDTRLAVLSGSGRSTPQVPPFLVCENATMMMMTMVLVLRLCREG